MEYTVLAVLSVLVVLALEFFWLRTGLFRTLAFWISYGIVLFFHVLVDGWLTKLTAPIVIYNPDEFSGRRFPFDIPVEDYLFGFFLIVLPMLLWVKAGQRGLDGEDEPASG